MLTFFLAVCVDITGEASAVGEPWGVPAFPQIFVDLADTPGAGFAALPFVGLEGGGHRLPWGRIYILGSFRFDDPTVNFGRRGFPHLIRDMSVDIECCCGGNMTDDGGQGFDVHAVFQRCGGECVPEIVKPNVLAVGPFQYGGQPLADSRGISGGVAVYW